MDMRSNFPELGSELLGDEPQPEADMSTQDVTRTGFRGITHLVGLAQCTISKPEVQGPVLRSSCPPLKGTRVCAGDRRAKEGAGSVCEFKDWSLVKARCTTGTALTGNELLHPQPSEECLKPSAESKQNIRTPGWLFLRGQGQESMSTLCLLYQGSCQKTVQQSLAI